MRWIAFALSGALTLASGPVMGKESPDSNRSAAPTQSGEEMREAGDHFERGVEFFRVGKYEVARLELRWQRQQADRSLMTLTLAPSSTAALALAW